MNSKSLTCCVVFLLYTNLFSSTSPSSPVHINSTTSILNVTLPHSLSQSLENLALKTLTNQHHTGALYRAVLPNNLSGIEVSVVRLTGKSLWNAGARFSNVLIPARVSCVSFKAQNKDKEAARISRMILPGVCYGSSHGDYSVIEPLENDKKKKVALWRTWWWLWMVGLVLGFVLLWFSGFVCTMGLRILRTKKIQVMMEREANDGEVFESRWVGGSKMPSATVTRTLPDSESGFENSSHG
ncbi:hypothetical protein HA466_0037740 [Hirschfeldia incana]|nr:hypothetical protein HA466_0037740 [Hirschfeldia incana]